MATDRNPDIRRQQSATFVAPPRESGLEGLAEGVETIGNLAVGMRQNQLTEELQARLLREQDRTLTELERDPLEEEGGPEAALDPNDENALLNFVEQMTDLQTAANQGTSPITQLKIRQERILREYMGQYPSLRGRFQEAAQGVLGYSPIGARLRASEAAQRAGSGAGQPPIMKMLIDEAVKAGVNPALLATNPTEFWRVAQQSLQMRQDVAMQDQALLALKGRQDLAQITRSPQWAQFTSNTAAITWRERIRPKIEAFYEDLDITPGMSREERQRRIEESISDGRFRAMQLGLREEQQQGVAGMYERYVGSDAGTTNFNGVEIPVMGFETFRERVQPIMEQYDWALANIGDAKAMEAMEMFNNARSARVISAMPDDLITLSEVGKLFGADNTFSQVLTQGEIGNVAAEIAASFVNRTFGGRDGAGSGGREGAAVRPTDNPDQPFVPAPMNPEYRLPTPDEVANRTGMALSDVDTAYRMINERLGMQWLAAYEETGDLTYAAGTFALVAQYGNMVENSARGMGSLPSKRTDNSILDIVSDPSFADATVAAAQGYNPSAREQVLGGINSAIDVRAGEEINELVGRTLTTLNRQIPEGDLPITKERDIERQFRHYIEFDVDPGNLAMQFVMKDDVPEYYRGQVTRALQGLNSAMSGNQERRFVQLAMAKAHLRGQSDPKFYNMALQSIFSGGEEQ